jgi:hypothetical protein
MVHKDTPRRIPLKYYILLALLQVCTCRVPPTSVRPEHASFHRSFEVPSSCAVRTARRALSVWASPWAVCVVRRRPCRACRTCRCGG